MQTVKQLFIAKLLLMSSLTVAQEKEDLSALVTDRPDATEAPSVIQKNYIQIETGAFYESFEDNSFKTEDFTYNTTLFK